MSATQRYLQTGNSVCGTPPDTDTGLTREEEKLQANNANYQGQEPKGVV